MGNKEQIGMIGKRVDWNPASESILPFLNPGEYGKDKDGSWWVRAPKGGGAGAMITGRGADSDWKVIEHEDGTITVSPSLGFMREGGGYTFHGYLEKGVWREC